jgi:DNA-directed RNA polymerase specialized sigma24 family protein
MMSCATAELLIRSDPMRPADEGSAASAQEAIIHWGEASAFVRRRLQYELPSSSHGLIDDLVQECMVRMLRYVRRERVQNVEALLTEMARRTAIDALRRRTRWSALVTSDDDAVTLLPDPAARTDEPGDPLERLQFVVVEYFTQRDARCKELAVAFFAGDDWKAVAVAERRSHDVIRKQWSRCLGILREAAKDEKGPLLDWAQEE